jgi:hypothetical protein
MRRLIPNTAELHSPQTPNPANHPAMHASLSPNPPPLSISANACQGSVCKAGTEVGTRILGTTYGLLHGCSQNTPAVPPLILSLQCRVGKILS